MMSYETPLSPLSTKMAPLYHTFFYTFVWPTRGSERERDEKQAAKHDLYVYDENRLRQ